jgi:hypothetical protein
MATANEVNGYVTGNIADTSDIISQAIVDANEIITELSQSIPETPPYLELDDFQTRLSRVTLSITEPERPNIENLVDDAEIPTLGDIYIPSTPTVTSPTAPTISDIVLPEKPSVDIVPFAIAFPEDTITDTDVTAFEYTEAEYTSTLLDAAKAKLLSDVQNGGTGLGAAIETAIFERQEERDLIALEEAVENLKAEWGKAGFPLPDGVLAAGVQDIYEKDVNTRTDRSREIAIAQAELAQNNTQFAVTSSITMENMLLQHFNNVADRALDAAKSAVTLAVAVFNVQVDRFKTRLEAYRVGAQAYEAQLRGELAKVEIYKADMEGAKLEADIQEQRVSVYRQQVEAVNSIYSGYRTQVEAARVTAGIEAERLSAFKTRVEAQLDKVRALVATYEADTSRYNATIREGEAWANTQIKQQELQARNSETALSLAQDAARTNLQAFMNVAGMDIQKSQSNAELYIQIASAALGSLNNVVQLASTSAVTETTTV